MASPTKATIAVICDNDLLLEIHVPFGTKTDDVMAACENQLHRHYMIQVLERGHEEGRDWVCTVTRTYKR